MEEARTRRWFGLRGTCKVLRAGLVLSAMVTTLAVPVDTHADNVVTDDAVIRGDVRCLVVGGQLSLSSDPTQKSKAGLLMIFYLGRLDARSPELDLQKLVAEESSHASSLDLQSEIRRCSEALTKKAEELSRIGKFLMQQRK